MGGMGGMVLTVNKYGGTGEGVVEWLSCERTDDDRYRKKMPPLM